MPVASRIFIVLGCIHVFLIYNHYDIVLETIKSSLHKCESPHRTEDGAKEHPQPSVQQNEAQVFGCRHGSGALVSFPRTRMSYI